MKSALLIAAAVLAAGCQYAFSDVATRIRYALLDQQAALEASGSAAATLSLRPDHWPDGCRQGRGYRLVLSPYRGGKQVPTGEILVQCTGGGQYYTGMGSERVYVTSEMSVVKKADEDLVITVRRTPGGMEIVSLK